MFSIGGFFSSLELPLVKQLFGGSLARRKIVKNPLTVHYSLLEGISAIQLT